MQKNHTYSALVILLLLNIALLGQIIYLSSTYSLTPKQIAAKKTLSTLVGLPDLALVNESHYIRHRSLSSIFTYFNESPELLEYFPSTFVYCYAPYGHPSRIERVF